MATGTAFNQPVIYSLTGLSGRTMHFPAWSAGGNDTLLDLREYGGVWHGPDSYIGEVEAAILRAAGESSPRGYVLLRGNMAYAVDIR